MPYLLHDYLTGSNFGGHTFGNQMPFAVSSLINDTQSMTINIQPNKKYLIRMVSMSALFNHVVSFEDHRKFL
jgi:iron transport multicopper oxidase